LETFAKICVAASLETLREDLTYASATNRLLGNYSAKSLEPPLVKIWNDQIPRYQGKYSGQNPPLIPGRGGSGAYD